MEGDCFKWSVDFYVENRERCDGILKSLENFDEIPLLTTENFQYFEDGDLVRYIGMIQDVFNPEYYYQSYTCHKTNGDSVLKSGMYRDITASQNNEELKFDENSLEKRFVFFCIPIPFMSNWAENYLKKSLKLKNSLPNSMYKKRSIMDVEEDDATMVQNEKIKKECNDVSDARNIQNESHSVDNYFPLHMKNGLPCIVKMYGKEDECNVLVHHRVEVIGFLSLNPALESNGKECDAEDKALNPPPSLVPRIHSIFYRHLDHNNPLLNGFCITREINNYASEIRSDLHLLLTQILYGDCLAADYMICYLLSKVYIRHDGQPLGKFNINLYNITDELYGFRLFELLETLVTNIQYIPMTLQILNEKPFTPKKNYELNKIRSGRLQLCDGTYLILDETKLSTGNLDNTGCCNLQALQSLISNQEVLYDFSYFSVKFEISIPVLILSTGKSMLGVDIRLKLKPESPAHTNSVEETFAPALSFLQNEEACRKIRIYLTSIRLQNFEISEELMRRIAEDYTKLRQERNEVNSNDLHNLLVFSRLLALSYGRTSLTIEDWTRALEMETERRNRFN